MGEVINLSAEVLDLSALADDPENANMGTERGSDALDLSIAEFGFLEPGVVGEDNVIISGNKRKASATRQNVTKAVVIDLPDDHAVYVRKKGMRLSDPEDLEARRAAIALNRVGQLSLKWNPDVTEQLEKKGVSFKGFFAEDEIPHIHKPRGRRLTGGTRSEPTPTRKVGAHEIWQIGDAYVICGDSRDPEVYEHLFDAAGVTHVHGVITSPPYAEQRKHTYGGIPSHEYSDWFEPLQALLSDHLAADGSFFLNIKPHSHDGGRDTYVLRLVLDMVESWNWLLVDEFSWLRIGNPGSWPNRFKNGFEPVYHFARSADVKFRPRAVAYERPGSYKGGTNANNGNYFNLVDKDMSWETTLPSNVLDIKNIAESIGHSAAFPVELPEFFIRAFSDPGDFWLDPFAGSGSSLVAAVANHRVGLGIELLPENVAITIERLSQVLEEDPCRVS